MQGEYIKGKKLYFFASITLAVGILYFTREILIPLSLSLLLSFLLAPIVRRIERIGLRRIWSVLSATVFAFAIIGGFGWVFTREVSNIASELPRYTDNLRARIKKLKSESAGFFFTIKKSVEQVNQEINALPKPPLQLSQSLPNKIEIPSLKTPSQVIEKEGALTFLQSLVAPFIGPLSQALIVTVFVLFILIQREDLRDRIIRLIGEGHLHVTTDALDEAAEKVSKFLSMQLLINVGYGISVSIGLLLLGIPNAVLWGLISGTFRFVPYIGAWIAALCPIFLSFALDTGWIIPICTIGLFVILEIFNGNLVEPLLFGRTTGLSPLAVLVAAIFWGWIWGIVGLLVSTPLTVCLVVLGKYIPALRFITILFGNEPPLLPHVKLYQRLLATDYEEASEIAHEILKSHSKEYFYDSVFLPALSLAEEDRHYGIVNEARETEVRNLFRALIKEIEGEGDKQEVDNYKNTAPKLRITCLPGRDEADEISAIALSGLLRSQGHEVIIVGVLALANEMKESLKQNPSDVVVISSMPPSAVAHAKYLCKKIQSEVGKAKIIVGLWNAAGELQRSKSSFFFIENIQMISTFGEALSKIQQIWPIRQSLTTVELGSVNG